jgi:serine/threonine protein kinase
MVTPETPVASELVMDVHLGAPDLVIGQELGRGALGAVYRGGWRGQAVAVKVLNPAADLGVLRSEVQVLARTAHPNVIRLLAVSCGGDIAGCRAKAAVDGAVTEDAIDMQQHGRVGIGNGAPAMLVEELADGSLEQ